eukprot:gene38196-3327_t
MASVMLGGDDDRAAASYSTGGFFTVAKPSGAQPPAASSPARVAAPSSSSQLPAVTLKRVPAPGVVLGARWGLRLLRNACGEEDRIREAAERCTARLPPTPPHQSSPACGSPAVVPAERVRALLRDAAAIRHFHALPGALSALRDLEQGGQGA